MAPEEKQLLLQDLCARLPYGVRARFCDGVKEETDDVWDIDMFSGAINANYIIDDVEPYLRPMSSMTRDESFELGEIMLDLGSSNVMTNVIDFYNAHHLDHHGLIEKGLALEAPADMYKTE